MRIGRKGAAAIAGGAAVVSGLFALGAALAREGDDVRAARERLDGRWVATSVRSISGEIVGAEAGRFGLEFDGDRVVARGLAGVGESRGTYRVWPDARPAKIDLKLGSGVAVGIYALERGELTACFNPMDLPERLGLTERGRPDRLAPDEKRLLYTLRKAAR